MIGRKIIFLFVLILALSALAINSNAEPILYRHHIVMIQGDDPQTQAKEPKNELYAIERFYFLIPANETWVDVPVPKVAREEGMDVDHVIYNSQMGFIPGEYASFWNTNDPPLKQFKDMTDMDCCIADFYAWGFPDSADRNMSVQADIDTKGEFLENFNDEKSDNAWNFSVASLSLKQGIAQGTFISTSSELGFNISEVEMSWAIENESDNVSFYVSVDNGTTWLDITQFNGKAINYSSQGNMLVWKINMSQDIDLNNTPILTDLWINVSYIPRYTDITLQLDYVVERKNGKFEYTWDLYADMKNGVYPHILIYTDLDYKLESKGMELVDFGTQEEYPDKEVFIFMSGFYSPETTITISEPERETQFPWFLVLMIALLALIILIVLLNLPRKKDVQEAEDAQEEVPLDTQSQGELAELKAKKQGLLKAMKKLDGDFQEGIIDEDVYLELKSGYKQKTIEIMKRIDALGVGPVPSSGISSPEKEKVPKNNEKLDSDYEEALGDEKPLKES